MTYEDIYHNDDNNGVIAKILNVEICVYVKQCVKFRF